MAPRPPALPVLQAMAARGEYAAVEQLLRPWATQPNAALPLVAVWADALRALGQGSVAVQVWQLVVARSPTPEHRVGLARALIAIGHHEGALQHLLSALPTPEAPTAARVLTELCSVATPSPALQHALAAAVHMQPHDLPLALARVSVHQSAGDLRGASQQLRSLVAAFPQRPEPALLLASVLTSVGQLPAAAALAAQACRLAPQAVEPRRVAALIAQQQGDLPQAARHLDAAMQWAPDHPGLLWARARLIPAIPESHAAEQAALTTYDAHLHALHTLADRSLDTHPHLWWHALQDAFPVHYASGDHLERQALHGRLIQRVVEAVVPHVAPAPPARTRTRVGFVSSAFRRHTVTKLFFRWMRDLDRQRFEVVGYHTGRVTDATTDTVRDSCDLWRPVPGSLTEAISAIRADAPDALIFPELGMNVQVLAIAALRLAPRQLMAWGHPITPGLSTIDGFLSSAAMAVEPDRTWTTAPRHDFAGIGVVYDRPPTASPLDRTAWQLPTDRPLLLCVQSLQKYRPQHDAIHAAVAAGAPHAMLVFVEDASPHRTARFRARLQGAFAAIGLDLDQHVCFLPRLSEPEWMGLLAAGDLFLDSPGWSGGNTTLEAIAVGLPCLAWPGDTFRGRHCVGINRELGILELCPPSPEAWIDTAIALAHDATARARLRAEVNARSARVFGDTRSLAALTDLLDAPP